MEGPLKKLATRADETLRSNYNRRRPLDPNQDYFSSSTSRESVLFLSYFSFILSYKEELETKRSIKQSVRENIEKKSDHSPNSFKNREVEKDEETTSSCASLNKTFVKKDISSDEFVPEPVPPSKPSFSRDLNVGKKSSEQIEDCCRNIGKFDMDRPMTRRNEIEDDLPEERVLAKFRNSPEEGQIVVDSSLEELQAKLQTISESTESSLSTPRNRKFVDSGLQKTYSKEVQSSGCNTETVKSDTQAIQTESEKANVGIMCLATCEDKNFQVSHHVFLSSCHIDVQTVMPQPRPLVETQLKTHEILPKPGGSKHCKFENLPGMEVAPNQENEDCKSCRKCLIEEHLPVVTIPSKRNKVHKLSVKILPPISINQNMIIKQVLNFFIPPHGETINYLQETENTTFFVMKSVKGENACPITVSFCEEEEVVEGVVETVDAAAKGHKTDFDIDEEMKRKTMIYQSYNLFDNRNNHDPGKLDAKSVERISGIDTNVYKTFINPTGMSEMTMSFRQKPDGIAGFESKAIQCNEDDQTSLVYGNKKSADSFPGTGRSSSKELNFVMAESAPSFETRKGKGTSSVDKHDDIGQSQVTIVAQQEFESEDLITHRPEVKKSSIENIDTLEAIVSEARLQSAQNKADSSHRKLESPSLQKSEMSQQKSGTSQQKSELSELHSSQKTSEVSHRFSGTSHEKSDWSEQMSDVPEALPEPQKIATSPKSHESKDTPAQYAGPQPIQRKLEVDEPMPRALVEADYCSTPSEITVTISYSLSSEGSTNSRDIKTDVNRLPNQSKSVGLAPKKDDAEPKVMTVKDIDIINMLKNKLRTLSVDSSDPKLIIKEEMSQETTNFIKGLIRMSTPGPIPFDPEDDTSRTSEEIPNSQNVNYHMIDARLDSNVILYPDHLIVAKNGRYKDEENLFAQSPYPKPASVQRKMFPPTPTHKTEDKEIQNDILGAYPKQMANKYSPESSNSNTVTSNSLSEGEIPCKHTVSNGEIHVCKRRYQVNHKSRVILPRSNLTSFSMNPSHNMPSQRQIVARSNLTNSSLNPIHTPNQRNVLNNNITRLSNSPNINIGPRKFDLLDPTLTIEKRRNYFNNWVTYYVKSQDILDSSTSSCSHNK